MTVWQVFRVMLHLILRGRWGDEVVPFIDSFDTIPYTWKLTGFTRADDEVATVWADVAVEPPLTVMAWKHHVRQLDSYRIRYPDLELSYGDPRFIAFARAADARRGTR